MCPIKDEKIAHYPIRTSDLTIPIHLEYEWHALPLSQAGYVENVINSIYGAIQDLHYNHPPTMNSPTHPNTRLSDTCR